ncbi:MAG TPA: hypothetical protein VM008_19630 [Phycisphaerae bacterium]|nr:hypothetical protein [Phycisphaerae bacterium]
MHIELLEMWMHECRRAMTESFPSFREYPSKPFVGPGCLFFDTAEAPRFFFLFQASEKRDAFTVELAWNVNEVFPLNQGYSIPRNWPEIGVLRTDTNASQFRFRLSKLWAKPKYDPWWEFVPPLRTTKSAELSVVADQNFGWQEKCAQLVGDAIEKIQTYGIPYMREIRQRTRNKPHSLSPNGLQTPRTLS